MCLFYQAAEFLDIPDLFCHIKVLMKNEAEANEENKDKEVISEMPVRQPFISLGYNFYLSNLQNFYFLRR
jgi:hypothetical protein